MSTRAQPHPARRPVAAIVFRYVHHYRREFYEGLREQLDGRGVELRLIAGQPGPGDLARHDAVTLPWAVPITNTYVPLGGRDVVWQPCFRLLRDADLVIVEQASRLVANHVLLAWRLAGGPKLAMWGHGHNIQPHRASRIGERVKRSMSARVDWWFAYNERSASVVAGLGFPADRTTVVQNAIDTRDLRRRRAELSEEDLAKARRALGVTGARVGVFNGSLYADKRLGFLVDAADRVRRRVPDFELLVVGDGPDAALVRRAAAERPWLHYPGPLYGREKVRALAVARAALCPGLVGLGILDDFALGLPLVTTAVPFHSHEVTYLEPGVNGSMVADWRDPGAYAAEVEAVMTDDALLSRLRAGCETAAGRYTVEAMSENFAEGVVRALRAPRRGRRGAA